MKCRIFKRAWWRENSAWPNGLEPYPGKRKKVKDVDSESEAIEFCHVHNKDDGGRFAVKHEFTRISQYE